MTWRDKGLLPQHRTIDVGEGCTPGQRHGDLELLSKNRHDAVYPVGTGYCQSVEKRPTDHDGRGPSRQSLQNIRPATHPAVDEHWDTACDLVHNSRQRVDSGGRRVELTPTVIRDINPGNAFCNSAFCIVWIDDALQDDRNANKRP